MPATSHAAVAARSRSSSTLSGPTAAPGRRRRSTTAAGLASSCLAQRVGLLLAQGYGDQARRPRCRRRRRRPAARRALRRRPATASGARNGAYWLAASAMSNISSRSTARRRAPARRRCDSARRAAGREVREGRGERRVGDADGVHLDGAGHPGRLLGPQVDVVDAGACGGRVEPQAGRLDARRPAAPAGGSPRRASPRPRTRAARAGGTRSAVRGSRMSGSRCARPPARARSRTRWCAAGVDRGPSRR